MSTTRTRKAQRSVSRSSFRAARLQAVSQLQGRVLPDR
jgi:hypothetical protein